MLPMIPHAFRTVEVQTTAGFGAPSRARPLVEEQTLEAGGESQDRACEPRLPTLPSFPTGDRTLLPSDTTFPRTASQPVRRRHCSQKGSIEGKDASV